MKTYSEFVNENKVFETFVNIFDKQDFKKYEEEVWPMLLSSYSYLVTDECPTGIANVNDFNDVIDETDFIKLVRRNGKVVAAMFYKMKNNGRKLFLGCCDNSEQGKKDFAKIFEEDFKLKKRRSYFEVSDKVEHLLIDKLGYKKYIIPADKVEKILGKPVRPESDNIHYLRKIGGKLHRKVLMGNPKQ